MKKNKLQTVLIAALIALTSTTAITAQKRGVNGQDADDDKHIDKKPKVNEKNVTQANNQLKIAIRSNNPQMLEAAIEAGAQLIPLKDSYCELFIPLIEAVYQGHNDCTKLLIEHGADIDFQDADGKTALHWGIAQDRAEAVNLLLIAGADVNKQDEDGNTLLHKHYSPADRYARPLIIYGADVNKKNTAQKSPMDFIGTTWITNNFNNLIALRDKLPNKAKEKRSLFLEKALDPLLIKVLITIVNQYISGEIGDVYDYNSKSACWEEKNLK